MESAKTDTRVQVTKKLLKDALLRLMQKKDFSEITVSAICKEADVNRSTFYAHYAIQQDLLDEIIRDYIQLFQSFFQQKDLDNNRTLFYSLFLPFVQQHVAVFSCLFRGSQYALEREKIIREVYNYVVSTEGDALLLEAIDQYTVSYLIQGSINAILFWIQNGMDLPIPEMAELLGRINNAIIREMTLQEDL
ncbi:MAG: TetR/AcrR family transcriptional regulator [Firmicutes bacterium]|nr:TetR/AcrR family transcriptional regulator [Bacillota bacterium]